MRFTISDQSRYRRVVFVTLCCLLPAVCAAGAEEQRPAMRLRVEWGGGGAKLWSGLLELSDGHLERPTSLGVEADEPGTMGVEGDSVWMHRRVSRVYDGLDITAVAPLDATLTVTLQTSGDSPLREQTTIPISEISEKLRIVPLGEDGARLVLSRTPGDALSIKVDRPHLIYECGERFVASARLNLLAEDRKEVSGTLRSQLAHARSKSIISEFNRSFRTSTNPQSLAAGDEWPIEIDLPSEEGVYDVRVSAVPDGLPEQHTWVQVVVLSRALNSQLLAHETRRPALRVDHFQPDKAGLLRKVQPHNNLLLPASAFGLTRLLHPLTLEDSTEFTESSSAPPPSAPPSDETPKLVWNAYWLAVKHPGQRHHLVITLAGNDAQHLGVSLIEPNAAGQVMPIGLDAGAHVVGQQSRWPKLNDAETSADVFQQRLTIWPKTKQPILLLHNLESADPIRVRNVELFEVPLSQPPPVPQQGREENVEHVSNVLDFTRNAGTLKTCPTTNLLTPRAPSEPATPAAENMRLIGPYMHKPLLAENFGATEEFDALGQRSLDDWVTFTTAAQRLVGYLKSEGFNSLMLAAFADGSGIYPSRLLRPTPRYDTGAYFSTGQDPLRKDVLELLYRLFDREGLVLVPELQFSTPLPALEQLLAQHKSAATERGSDENVEHVSNVLDVSRKTGTLKTRPTTNSQPQSVCGIELIGRDGQSWRESQLPVRGLAPYYNPLDPRVQSAIQAVVQELVDRYSTHTSFQGLAVELSGSGYLQFPGLDWGYDDATIARFESATGIKVPTPSPAAAATQADPIAARCRHRSEFLTGQVRAEWIRWRCQELAAFHRKLALAVKSAKPSARLILSGNQILMGGAPDDLAATAVKTGDKLDDVLYAKGLDFRLHTDKTLLTVLRPHLDRVADQWLGDVLDDTVNRSPVIDAAFSGPQSGCLFYHLPKECRVAGFDAVSPWQPSFTWLAAHVLPLGTESRKPYIRAMAAADAAVLFDGGWMIPFGAEDATRGVRDRIRALPAVDFRLSQIQRQPAVIRTGQTASKTYLYVVNDFCGTIDVDLELTCSDETRWHAIGGDSATQTLPKGTGLVRTRIGAYGLWACELDSSSVNVASVTVRPETGALSAIEDRIHEFEQKMRAIREKTSPQPSNLVNPGFEMANHQTASRQTTDEAAIPGWELSVREAALWTLDRHNSHSGASSLLLTSDRGKNASLTTDLDLNGNRVVTTTLWMRSDRDRADAELALEGTLDGNPVIHKTSVGIGRDWRRYVFRVNDVPARDIRDTRFRVSMLSPGRLWIDDAQIHTHELSDDEARLLTKVFSAVTLAWNEKRYADCQRLLESYWGQLLFRIEEQTAKPLPPEPRRLPASIGK